MPVNVNTMCQVASCLSYDDPNVNVQKAKHLLLEAEAELRQLRNEKNPAERLAKNHAEFAASLKMWHYFDRRYMSYEEERLVDSALHKWAIREGFTGLEQAKVHVLGLKPVQG